MSLTAAGGSASATCCTRMLGARDIEKMPVRKDPFESGKQRIQEGLTELLELTEPLDAYRERLRTQIKHADQNKDVSRHRVQSAFSRIANLIRAKEHEMLQRLDVLCDEAKSKAGEKLRETASVTQETAKVMLECVTGYLFVA